ncbi:MAG: hypothetical protein Q7I93_01180 [Syntrophales bacterium]|nr:hypothetical protein [Syntrophales bacterium]
MCHESGQSTPSKPARVQFNAFRARMTKQGKLPHVGAEEVEADDGMFEEKMAELSKRLYQQMQKSHQSDEKIRENLATLGFGGE